MPLVGAGFMPAFNHRQNFYRYLNAGIKPAPTGVSLLMDSIASSDKGRECEDGIEYEVDI